MTYRTTDEFLKMFGLNSLDDLPELPKYKLDENEQIVLDDFDEDLDKEVKDVLTSVQAEPLDKSTDDVEAPTPARVTEETKQE